MSNKKRAGLKEPLLDEDGIQESDSPAARGKPDRGAAPSAEEIKSPPSQEMSQEMSPVSPANDEDEEDGLGFVAITFYKPDSTGYVLSWLATVCTAGLLLLVFRWTPVFQLRFTHKKCESYQATKAVVRGSDGTETVVSIDITEMPGSRDRVCSFLFRLVRYFEDERDEGRFKPAQFDARQRYSALLKRSSNGLTTQQVQDGIARYGPNLADVPVKSHMQLLVDEILHPFYIFQMWSVIVWYLEPYILYATAIAVISLISALISLLSTRKNLEGIRKMAHFECEVTVLRRDGEREQAVPRKISSKELVPGDVIELVDNFTIPCDLVLCSGGCIVNESMLTGESLPVLKSAVPVFSSPEDDGIYSPDQDKRFTLFCGTRNMEARRQGRDSPVLAIVLRTGFSTAKGKLVRSILFPKPANFKLYADSFKFVTVMAVMATLGFVFSIKTFVEYNVDLSDIILNACDVVTIAVPPALPAAMTIGTEFALERLKKAKIFCISPNRVNVAGQIDIMCFDKTGTLTEEGVDVMGVMSLSAADEQPALSPLQNVETATLVLQQCLATCHGLTNVGGTLVGDPLDLKMFESTEWTLEEPVGDQEDSVVPPVVYPPEGQHFPHFASSIMKHTFGISMPTPGSPGTSPSLGSLQNPPTLPASIGSLGNSALHPISPSVRRRSSVEAAALAQEEGDTLQPLKKQGLAIVRRFDFTSQFQRMSVVVRKDNEKGSHIFVKGAPEVIQDLCNKDTVPENFTQIVQMLTKQGLRILACAHRFDKKLSWHSSQRITRDKAESDVDFIGLLLMENRLKPETSPVIQTLREACVTCCMVTGDHVLTGVTVSKHCGLLSLNGGVFLSDVEDVMPERIKRRSSWTALAIYEEEEDEEETEDRDNTVSERMKVWGKFCSGSERDLPDAGLSPTADSHDAAGGMEIQDTHQKKCEKRVVFRALDEDSGIAKVYTADEMVAMIEGHKGARDWNIALTGSAYAVLQSDARSKEDMSVLATLMDSCRVYARMSPDQKQSLIETYASHHGYTVGMCGDGANDCGALKAAHVGLSLSDAEASIAAPFTASEQNIKPLLSLMREGRAALVTSISCFKFMALYSVIQFVTVIRLYQLNTNMSDMQYLWIDLFVIFPLAVYMARTGPYKTLSKRRPQSRLISVAVLSSVLGQSLIAFTYQVFAAYWTYMIRDFKCDDSCPGPKYGGFCDPSNLAEMPHCCASLPLGCKTRPIDNDTEDQVLSVEASSAFLFAQFQYLGVVICFNTSKPFRRSMTTNGLFFGSWVILTAIACFLTLAPDELILRVDAMMPTLEIQEFPTPIFKWKLFALALVNFFVSYVYEMVVEVVCTWREDGRMSRSVSVMAIFVTLALCAFGPLAAVFYTPDLWIT